MSRHPRSHPVRFAAPALGTDPATAHVAPLVPSASLRSSSTRLFPSTSLVRASPRTTIVAGDIVHVRHAPDRVVSDRPVPVTTAVVSVSLNRSVMSMTVQQVHPSACSPPTGQLPTRLVASGDFASLVPSASLRSSSARPLRVSRRPVRARLSPASALPLALVSGPLHAPPSVCSTRPPSLPPALTATQSPWRLPPACLARVDSPSLIPQVSRC